MPVRSQTQRILVLILCALLLTPLLAAVPVYAADGDMYSYNGTVLPALPSVSISTYPYRFIYFDVSIDTYVLLFLNLNLTKWTNELRTVSPYEGKFITYNLVDNIWSSRNSGSLVGQTQYCHFNEGDSLVWCLQDVLYSGQTTVFMSGSDPVLAVPEPTVPTLTTSFDGQVISLDAGSLRFFITATNVNGTLSCQWYVNGAPISDDWSFIEAEPGVWLQGWVYTPIENGTREMYCIVTNTVGDKSASVSTGTVIVHYGVSGGGGGGSGDLSQVTDKLEVLDMDISELKNSVQAVQDSVDALPDKITDGIQSIVDQENENAESEGNKFVDQITGLVPNDSQGFIDSMGSLVNVLSYDGTDCVLTIPALTIPAIEPHFSEFTVLEAQQLDFEEYINMMPPNLLLLIRSLLTGALIVYCFKELYGVISYFFVLKGGET